MTAAAAADSTTSLPRLDLSDSAIGGDSPSKNSERILKTLSPKQSFTSPNAKNAAQPTPGLSPMKRRQRHNSESSNNSRVIQTAAGKTLYTAGRPPWFNWMGEIKPNTIIVIGICGGSGSGKTTVARRIIEQIDVQWVSILTMDSFYKVLTPEQHEAAMRCEYDFDHPNAFDLDLVASTLTKLKDGKKINVPIYNFTTHLREIETKTIYGANVVIFEGIMSFCDPRLLELMDLKIFVDTDADIRLSRRLRRDISERGRELSGVLKQYNKFVKPAYDKFIAPTCYDADIVVPRGGENTVALNLIVQHVNSLLTSCCVKKIRDKLLDRDSSTDSDVRVNGESDCGSDDAFGKAGSDGILITPRRQQLKDVKNLFQMPQTNNIESLLTIIRNRATKTDEFIFYSKRLIRLLIEYGLSLLPFEKVTVRTPQGVDYSGERLAKPINGASSMLCGVSILRAGETLEPALREICKDVEVGKLLIQTNPATGEPELHYLRFPTNIQDQHVMLLDATVASGAAAIMAIRILLDHDVQQDRILLVALLMSRSGALAVAYAFPEVKIITVRVDEHLSEIGYISPGFGNFGDRYFGTGDVEDCLETPGIAVGSQISSDSAFSALTLDQCNDS